ncbi:unnamed protein product [Parnassius apollo]|uniref:(apollo) hypothetical protein n=1 Tax=Parnassius apollo TaxID=110799 RepID=A0A8S3WDB8_PARAO|nr:unnamed protein product [Parnassius apollo]
MLKWQRTQKIMALVPPAKAPSDDSSTSEDEVIINNYTKPKKQQSSDSEHNYESSEPRSYPSEIDDLSLDSHSEDEIPATPSPRPLQLQNESKSYLPNSKENSRPTTPPSPTPPQQNDCNIPEVPCSEVQTPISSASMPQDIMNDSILHIPTIPLSPLINQMFSPGPSNQPLPFTLNSVSSVLSPNMSPAAPNTQSECKKTWANLRESYRRAVVKKRTKSGQATSSKKWQFEEEMSFLLPHMKQRKTISSLTEDDSKVDDNFYVNELLSNHDDSPMSPNDPELNITNRPESSSTNTSANSPLFPNIPKRKRFKGTQECTSASAQLLQYLLKEKELQDAVLEEWEQIPQEAVATLVRSMKDRMEAVIKARGTGGGPADYILPDYILDRVISLLGSTFSGFTVPFGGDKEMAWFDVCGGADNIVAINIGNVTVQTEQIVDSSETTISTPLSNEKGIETVVADYQVLDVVDQNLITPNKTKRLTLGTPRAVKKKFKPDENRAARNTEIAAYYSANKKCLDAKLTILT